MWSKKWIQLGSKASTQTDNKNAFFSCTTDLLDPEGESAQEAVSRICKAATFGQVVISGFRLLGQWLLKNEVQREDLWVQ